MAFSLLFDGDIELNSDVAEDDGYQFQLLPSSRRGDPIPVEVTLASFLRDGTIVETDRWDNRELIVQVRVSGPDSLVLALGEQRLNRAVGKRTTLVWESMDGIAPATVFEVLTSSLSQPQDDRWDLHEIRNQRTYTLRLVCLPFARSVDRFTDDADTPASTGTVEDACDSATGWSSASPAAAPTTDSTIKVQGTASVKCEAATWADDYTSVYGYPYSFARNIDTKVVSIDTDAGGYLSQWVRFDWPDGITDNPSTVTIRARRASTGTTWQTLPIAAVELAPDNWVRYAWPEAGGDTVTELEYTVEQWTPYAQPRPFVRYDAIILSDAATTDSQIVKTFDVPGSARGPGSLYIASPDDAVALGQVFVATMHEDDIVPGFRPDGDRWEGVGYYDVPASILAPGPYTIVAQAQSGANPLTVEVEAQLRIGGVDVDDPSTQAVSLYGVGTDEMFVTVGTVYLPPTPMQNPASDAFVRFTFSGGATVSEFFMIPASADYSIIDCGDGTVSGSGASSHLWIDSPDAEQPLGGWWRGAVPERVSARSAWPDVVKPGRHMFKAGRMTAFVMTTNATGARVTLDGYKWWFGNAAE